MVDASHSMPPLLFTPLLSVVKHRGYFLTTVAQLIVSLAVPLPCRATHILTISRLTVTDQLLRS